MITGIHLEILDVLSTEDVETFLVRLVSNAKANSGAKHHLCALKMVENYIFQIWLKGLRVEKVKVDHVISRYLDSDVALRIKQKSSVTKSMVMFPNFLTTVILFRLTLDLLEEENL